MQATHYRSAYTSAYDFAECRGSASELLDRSRGGPFIPFFMLAGKQLRMLLPRRKQEADAAWAELFIPSPKLRLRDQVREVMPAANGPSSSTANDLMWEMLPFISIKFRD